MKKRKNIKKKNIISNIIFNIIALISTIIAVAFCIYLYKLDMLPGKYLTIIFVVLGVFYLILLGLTLPRHLKIGFKIGACVFFLIFSFIFIYGIKYVDKTISFVDKINDELKQKEEYQLKTLSKNKMSKENLDGKKVGIFKNANYDSIVKYIGKKNYKLEIVEYSDPIKLFEDLESGEIDLIIASDNVYELLETELDYMKLELSDVDVLEVPVDEKTEDIVKVVDVTNTPFNIYIAGGDAYGSINKVMNTDVNMVATVDPVKHKILLTSIPRDYYVNLPGKGDDVYDKLTHAGYYGVGESIKAIEKLLDIDINYYIKVNYSTIVDLVDVIGGIDINSEKSFTTSDGSYHYNKGINHADGKKALRFARERKVFNDGDVTRVKNQQIVISAIINKISSSSTLISKYTSLLDAISASFATSLDTKSINRLVKMQINDMKKWNIESQNLVGHSATSKNCYSIPNMNLYVMKQDEKSVNDASTKIKEFLKG